LLVTINGDANLHKAVSVAAFSCLMEFILFKKQKCSSKQIHPTAKIQIQYLQSLKIQKDC
jgi:hypothetical protein